MKFLVILFTLVLSVAAAPYYALDARGLPIPPSSDPFYTPPAGYESQPVGTILKKRQMSTTYGVVVIPEKIKAVYQLLVRSEDSFGNPNAITTALYVPKNGDPSKLLSYQVAEDSASLDCAPSYAYQLGANPQTIISAQLEQILSQAGLDEGWYVSVPDYEGPKAAFGCGHQAGKAVLNSIRAVLNSGNITGINKDAKVAYWGYSGGSLATGWTSLLQNTYAPDLNSNTIGYALGGIVANVEHTASTNMGGLFAGLIFAAMNGLSHEYPTINDYINQNVFPEKLSKFRDANHLCEIIYIPEYVGATWKEYFKNGDNTLYDEAVRNVTAQNNMITSGLTPVAPLFFYNAKFDEIIPAADADDFYSELCQAGVSIEYVQSLVGGHITEAVLGAGSAFTWLKDRHAGKTQSGCSKNFTFSSAITREGLSGLGEVIIDAIFDLLGRPLGPYDLLF